MRLTKDKYFDAMNFTPYLRFFKDGEEFARISMELLQDLTFITHDSESPFRGPELSAKDAFHEIYMMLRYELNDSSLDDELLELLHAKYDNKKN